MPIVSPPTSPTLFLERLIRLAPELRASPTINATRANPITILTSTPPRFLIFCNVAIYIKILCFYTRIYSIFRGYEYIKWIGFMQINFNPFRLLPYSFFLVSFFVSFFVVFEAAFFVVFFVVFFLLSPPFSIIAMVSSKVNLSASFPLGIL